MLPARFRLRRRGEFAAVLRSGRRAGQRLLVAHVVTPEPTTAEPTTTEAVTVEPATAATAGGARVGLVVGRSVGSAVVRNRVKRQLRHLVADRLATLPAGSSVVLRALPAARGASFADLGADLDRALARLRHRQGRRV